MPPEYSDEKNDQNTEKTNNPDSLILDQDNLELSLTISSEEAKQELEKLGYPWDKLPRSYRSNMSPQIACQKIKLMIDSGCEVCLSYLETDIAKLLVKIAENLKRKEKNDPNKARQTLQERWGIKYEKLNPSAIRDSSPAKIVEKLQLMEKHFGKIYLPYLPQSIKKIPNLPNPFQNKVDSAQKETIAKNDLEKLGYPYDQFAAYLKKSNLPSVLLSKVQLSLTIFNGKFFNEYLEWTIEDLEELQSAKNSGQKLDDVISKIQTARTIKRQLSKIGINYRLLAPDIQKKNPPDLVLKKIQSMREFAGTFDIAFLSYDLDELPQFLQQFKPTEISEKQAKHELADQGTPFEQFPEKARKGNTAASLLRKINKLAPVCLGPVHFQALNWNYIAISHLVNLMTAKDLKFPVRVNLYNIASADVISFIVEMEKNNIPFKEYHWKYIQKFKKVPEETINFILGKASNPTPSFLKGKTKNKTSPEVLPANQELTEINRLTEQKRQTLKNLNIEFEKQTVKLKTLNLELPAKINKERKLDSQITEKKIILFELEENITKAQKKYNELIKRSSRIFVENRKKFKETSMANYETEEDEIEKYDEDFNDPFFISLDELREKEE